MRRIVIGIVVILVAVGFWWGLRAKPAPIQTATAKQVAPEQPEIGEPAAAQSNNEIVTAIQQGFQSASKEMNEKLDTLLGRTNKIDGKVDVAIGKLDEHDKRLARLEACQPGCKPGVAARSRAKSSSSQKPAATRPKGSAKKPAATPATPPAAVVAEVTKPFEPAADDHHRRAPEWRTPWGPGVTDGNTYFAQATVVQDQQIRHQTVADKKKGKSNCGNPCR